MPRPVRVSAAPAKSSIRGVLQSAVWQLSDASDSARLDAEVLLADALGEPRHITFAHPEKRLDALSLARFQSLVRRRARGEPVAYITGNREFWSLPLSVSPDTLIPRPETELLVERALERFAPGSCLSVADIGTGCGAIALALAAERPEWTVVATDVSERALGVAAGNARHLGLARIEFRAGCFCAALAGARVDLLVSNPPYVAEDDPHLSTGDLRYEPYLALCGGRDGLRALDALIREAPASLERPGEILLEHGAAQARAVAALLATAGFEEISTACDYAGHARVTQAIIR